MRVEDLIKKIPSNTHDIVKKTYKRFNHIIRDAIRSEIRLSLNPGEPSTFSSHAKGEVSISVDKIGYPTEIEMMVIPDAYRLAAVLSLLKPTLEQLRNSSTIIDDLLINPKSSREIELADFVFNAVSVIKSLAPAVSDTKKFAEILLKEAKEFDLVNHILSVNKDILGHYQYKYDYFYRSSEHASDEAKCKSSSKILLYWGVIGLVAISLGVGTDDLTVVVLTHELAHAYTHLGYDIDQYRWDALSFHESQHELKEGLAQYYTARVMDSLEKRIPSCKKVYELVLEKQPPAYHGHVPWVKNSTPEAVRSALVVLRKEGVVGITEFGELLFNITADYKK